MRTIHTNNGKHKVVIFDSSKQLTPRRYQKYNKHEMISLGVGENIGDYNNRMSKAIGYVKSEDHKSALAELTNQQQCLYNALEEYSPSNLAFAVLVHSIDGEVFKLYDEDSLEIVIDKLDEIGFTKEDLLSNLAEVKKK